MRKFRILYVDCGSALSVFDILIFSSNFYIKSNILLFFYCKSRA